MPTDVISISPSFRRAVTTHAATRESLSAGAASTAKTAAEQAWELVKDTLIDWGTDPSQLEEEGTVTPSLKTIKDAYDHAKRLCLQGCPAPIRVVPDAYGAIVFEFQWQESFQSIHIHADGSVEFRSFEKHCLKHREFLCGGSK